MFDALKLMAEKNIGALPVVENGELIGLVSERDYARKVILRGKSSHETPVKEIMTKGTVCVRPGNTIEECMALMTGKHVRHLPVIENEKLLGILSIGDQMIEGQREREMIRAALGRLLPEEVARRLLAESGRMDPQEAKATVLLCDIEDFTRLTDSLGPHRVVEFLNAYFAVAGEIVERHHGVITQFQGDAVLAVFNLPLVDPDHSANALRASIELVRAADERKFSGVCVRNRVGISTGRVVAGAVGSHGRLSYTVHGTAVNLASRIEELNKLHGTRILLTGKTAERCPDFDLMKVADAEIRGYGETVPLFTLRSDVVQLSGA